MQGGFLNKLPTYVKLQYSWVISLLKNCSILTPNTGKKIPAKVKAVNDKLSVIE